jgi:YfiR/HmsC-like
MARRRYQTWYSGLQNVLFIEFRDRMKRYREKWSLLISVILISALIPQVAKSFDAEEPQIKAAYLYQFTRFVEWPESSFNSPDSEFNLCVLGVNSFGVALSLLSQRAYETHPIVLRFLNTVKQTRDCQLLYISISESDHESDILTSVSNSPVLTVSSLPGFVERGGIIEFVRTGNHVRFSINHEACKRQGLACSAKLLEVAVKVMDSDNRGNRR